MRGIALFLSLVLLGCGVAGASGVNPYWERISHGLPNNTLVLEHHYERHDSLVTMNVRVPQIWGMTDSEVQAKLNEALASGVQAWVDEIASAAEIFLEEVEAGSFPNYLPFTLWVDYETQYNKGGLLSLVVSIYAYTGGAHGMTHWEPLNLDLTTGRHLTFADLFPDKGSRSAMAEVVEARIKAEPEIFFLEGFDSSMFSESQTFYLREGEIVVFFGLYEIAPYSSGIQEFALPVR